MCVMWLCCDDVCVGACLRMCSVHDYECLSIELYSMCLSVFCDTRRYKKYTDI